jgi:hypothetical protein
MQIYVKLPDGRTLSSHLAPTDTAECIKRRIVMQSGAHCQALFWQGKAIDGDLQAYGIQRADTFRFRVCPSSMHVRICSDLDACQDVKYRQMSSKNATTRYGYAFSQHASKSLLMHAGCTRPAGYAFSLNGSTASPGASDECDELDIPMHITVEVSDTLKKAKPAVIPQTEWIQRAENVPGMDEHFEGWKNQLGALAGMEEEQLQLGIGGMQGALDSLEEAAGIKDSMSFMIKYAKYCLVQRQAEKQPDELVVLRVHANSTFKYLKQMISRRFKHWKHRRRTDVHADDLVLWSDAKGRLSVTHKWCAKPRRKRETTIETSESARIELAMRALDDQPLVCSTCLYNADKWISGTITPCACVRLPDEITGGGVVSRDDTKKKRQKQEDDDRRMAIELQDRDELAATNLATDEFHG